MTTRPPLAVLFLFTVVSVCALAWLAWKVLDQDRLVDAQRSHERLEQEADRLATVIGARLADAGDRLANPAEASATAGGVLRRTESGLSASRPLLYWPVDLNEPEAPTEVFAESEQAEFTEAQPLNALSRYVALEASDDRAVRAGALLRKARVLRSLGRTTEALEAYATLARMTGVRVAGAPAPLVARRAIAELTGDEHGGAALRHDLGSGTWRLPKARFDFYWKAAGGQEPPPKARQLAEAVSAAWDRHAADRTPRGSETIWTESSAHILLWRGEPERRVMLIAPPQEFMPPTGDFMATLVDSQGRLLAGLPVLGIAGAAVRPQSTQLPWTLYVTPLGDSSGPGFALRQKLLLTGMGVLLAFLLVGTYFISQAIRREAEMVRLQTDFVATVSHEFRSPLTSLRQLSELLSEGRVPSEDRKQKYYETLVSETTRLQKLVEALLNFGRMDSGAFQPEKTRLEALELARSVERQLGDPRIRVDGGVAYFEADGEAVAIALRNLMDNALKYSEGPVEVTCGFEKGSAAFRVTDHGAGIAPGEHRAIFHKFVRGSAAASSNVKGSGVGLAMVARVAEVHGGSVGIERTGETGTTFVLRFPVTTAQAHLETAAEES